MPSSPSVVDAVCIGGMVLLTLAYNVLLVLMSRYKPHRVRHGLHQAARRAWTLDVMISKRDVLAVQTLRNSMMAASLLASTSLTLSSLVAAYLYRMGDDSGLWQVDHPPDSHRAVQPVFKLFVLLCSYMVSFFCFMQSLRSASTASFLIGLRVDGAVAEGDPDRVGDIVQKSALFHAVGSRAFIFSFVLLLWIFGAPAALVGAVVTTALHTLNDFVLGTRGAAGESAGRGNATPGTDANDKIMC